MITITLAILLATLYLLLTRPTPGHRTNCSPRTGRCPQ
jgi:hypothetical protein